MKGKPIFGIIDSWAYYHFMESIMNFKTKNPIIKGWSSDKKFHVADNEGRNFLLRLSDIKEYEKKEG